MNCPTTDRWDLLAMEVLEDAEAALLRAHLETCPGCRLACDRARRAHFDRVRMYDQLDHGHDSLREQLMSVLPPSPDRSRADRLVRGWRHMGAFTMSVKHHMRARAAIGVVSAAACIALVASLSLFTGNRTTLAAAIEEIQKHATLTCCVSSPTALGAGPVALHQSGRLYFSAEHGIRIENRMNGVVNVIQFKPPGGPMTTVMPLNRQYTVIRNLDSGAAADAGSAPDSFLLALWKLKEQGARGLGRAMVEGVLAAGYEIPGQLLGLGQGEQVRSELWIDPATNLPVRYVAEFPSPATRAVYQLVYDRFEWDAPVDPSLFVPQIPADYVRIEANMPAPDEAVLVKALGNYVELTGRYPPRLDATVIVTDLSGALGASIARRMAQGKQAPDQQALTRQSLEIGSGIAYYLKLAREGRTPEYHGKDVSPQDGSAVLVRWKLADGQWRVIYGDLRIETATAP